MVISSLQFKGQNELFAMLPEQIPNLLPDITKDICYCGQGAPQGAQEAAPSAGAARLLEVGLVRWSRTSTIKINKNSVI